MKKGLEQPFLQRGYTSGQQVHEKTLNIISCRGNADHNEVPIHTHLEQQLKKKKSWQGDRLEPLYTAGGNIKWLAAVGISGASKS